MSWVAARPACSKLPPPSVLRYTPLPHEELLRPLDSPVPTHTMRPRPFSVRSSALTVSPAAVRTSQPFQSAGAWATAMAPMLLVAPSSLTGAKVVPAFFVFHRPPVA